MIQSNRAVLLALLVPIIGLLVLTAYKKYILSSGHEYEFAIEGYDPRDLLAGHYIQFRVVYDANNICENRNSNTPQDSLTEKQSGYICLEPGPKVFSYEKPNSCLLFIEGICDYTRFVAGIERFYIPQEKAYDLEQKIRNRKASIKVSILASGKAQIKELLLDGRPWQDAP